MPTTFRFLFRLLIIGGIIVGIMYALATYVEPTPEPVSIRIAPERFEL